MLLGTAVGDAIGLPREGLSRARAITLFGARPFEHRLFFGRGMTSDDTEHACMTAQAWLAATALPSGDEREAVVRAFARSLAWRLRGWLLSAPGGIGWGTLRALIKLWMFFPPEKSGVRSAGNGPAMRAPILGACARDRAELRALVHASTVITHRDPRAEEGALVVAIAAAHAVSSAFDAASFLCEARDVAKNEELVRALELIGAHLEKDASVAELASELGLDRGVSGYINHTVPIVLYAWLRHRDSFRDALEATIALGGDTDSTGAILGGLMGATLGAAAIPRSWLDHLSEWPRTIPWMIRLAKQLAAPASDRAPVPLFFPGLLLRNPFFLLVVLAHGFRRLFPPY